MAVVARTSASRPPLHGRVVEVHDRRGLLKMPDVFDLRVIIWSPVFGIHAHSLPGVRGRAHAIDVAERIGQAEARARR